MPKFDSPIYITQVKSRSANIADPPLLHMGTDNRVGIGTESPETKLHVDGTITAKGIIVPSPELADPNNTAETFGFTPNFSEWDIDDNDNAVANGWNQTGSGVAEQSEERVALN